MIYGGDLGGRPEGVEAERRRIGMIGAGSRRGEAGGTTTYRSV